MQEWFFNAEFGIIWWTLSTPDYNKPLSLANAQQLPSKGSLCITSPLRRGGTNGVSYGGVNSFERLALLASIEF